MPPLALLVPVGLPLLASLVAAVAGRLGWNVGRAAAAAGAWGAAIAVVALWMPVRSTEELAIGQLGFGTGLDLRLDGVAVAFCLIVLIPAAILLSLQSRTWQETTVASLGVAAAVLAIEAGGVLLTAFAGCTAATLAVILLDIEDLKAPRPSWGLLLAAWLALAWAGVTLQVQGGTAVYAAVPVAALTTPVFGLLALAAVFASGLFPWRGWLTLLWARPSLRAAGLAVATLQPLGLYLLVRAYEMGNGSFPQPALNLALAAWGVLVAFGAAARAQAAATRRQYLAEVLPGLAGFSLMAVAVGSALGLVAALILLASSAVVAACLPLLSGDAGVGTMLVTAAAVGAPPGLAFGGRLLGLDAAFETGEAMGLIGLAGVATWLLSAAAAARSAGLPADREPAEPAEPAGVQAVAVVMGAALLATGPVLGVASYLGLTAAADVMSVPAGALGAGTASIVTVSTVLPAAALLGPLLVFGVIVLVLAGPILRAPRETHPPPLFELRVATRLARLRAQLQSAAVPEQYRSLLNPRGLELAAAGGSPAMWLAALIALGVAVSR